MKKLLLFSACIILALSSCKKDSPKTINSTGITATIGGSDFNFSTAATAQVISVSGLYSIQIIGSNGNFLIV